MRKRLRMQRGVTSGRIAGGERSNSVSPSSPNQVNYSAGAGAGSNAIMVMGDSVGLRAALLGTVAAGALWLGAPRYARAECSAPDATTVNCTGTIIGPFVTNGGILIPGTYSILNVLNISNSITPSANVDGINFVRGVAGATVTIISNTGSSSINTMGNADGIYADADGTIVINHTGDINAGEDGIEARAGDNAVDLTITTTGTITADGRGIFADHDGSGTLRITTTGDVTGGSDGVRAQAENDNGIVVTTNGAVTGTSGFGIGVVNYSGTAEIVANGDVEGGFRGIYARNGVSGDTVGTDLTVTTAEGTTVTGTNAGIFARNFGTGALMITASGDVGPPDGTTPPIPLTGIYALSDGNGGITIETQNVTADDIGIDARNNGSGEIHITTYGTVVGTNGNGISALNSANSQEGITITSASVTGGADGINAFNSGAGAVAIITEGDVKGYNNTGIYAFNSANSTGGITVESLGVTGDTIGIYALNSGVGALAIYANGDVVGNTATGIFGYNSVNSSGGVKIESQSVKGGDFGIRVVNYGAGAVDITANGVVESDGNGISAYNSLNSGGGIRIQSQDVSGRFVGIRAFNFGNGDLDITVAGDVIGNEDDGIYASSATSPIRIVVDPGASVTSGGALPTNFAIVTDSGATDLTVAGTLNGGGGGAVRFDQNDALDDRLALVTGAVVNGNAFGGPGTDTLALEGNGDGSFNVGQLVDFEIAEKTGGGDWDLTGNNTQITNFAVDAGLLAVNGALPNTAFAVSGGTLGGNGTVGPTTVADGATIAPGNSIGTLTVNGAFTLQAGAIYEVEANAAGEADRVIVAGTVNLSGAVLRVLAENGDYRLRTEYLIIENDGNDAVQGQFREVSTNLAFLTPTVLYDGGTGNDVVLILERIAADFCAVAQTRNQCAVANALDLFPTDDPLFLAVLNQTAAGARQAFDALSGEIHATLPGLLADDSRYVREAVLGRLTQAAYTNADGRVAALGTGGPQVASFNAGLDAQAMALGYDGKHLAPPPSRSGAAFWTRAYGAWGDFEGDGNAASADRDLGGFLSGVDADIGNGWRAGLAAGGAWSNVSVDARRSNAEVESVNLAGYVGGMAGLLALRGGGAWTWSDIDTNRAVVFPGFLERQSSGYDADTGQIFGEVAYPVAAGRLALEPFAGLAYVGIDTDSFRERGGNLSALNGSSDDEDVGYFSLGLRAATVLHTASMIVVPKLSAAWQHAFDDVTPGAALAFASNGIGFVIDGVPLAEDSFLLEAGLDLALSSTALLGVSYTGQFADSVSDNGVKGRFTWLF